jgi:imidazolonepropionase-like amidohydrolase
MKYLLLTLTCLLAFSFSLLFAQLRQPIVLEDATVIDSWNTVPITNCYVVIEGNKISNIGKRFEVVIPENALKFNMKGKYIIPGLIDVESQYKTPEELRQLLSWGVTSVNSSFESIEKARQLSHQTKPDTALAPEVYFTSPVFGSMQMSGNFNPGLNYNLTTPESARSAVRWLHAQKIQLFKILYDEQQMDSTIVVSLLDESRKVGIATSVQIANARSAQTALDAGATMLVRGVYDERIGSSILDQMIQRNTYYVSTLSRYEAIVGGETFFQHIISDSLFRLSLPQSVLQSLALPDIPQEYRLISPGFTSEHLKILYDNSGTIVKNYIPVPMGTDVPFLPGISAHVELENLVKAGLTPMQAIVSATAISAECLGMRKQVGFLSINYQADMLVLDRNPMEDIRNTRSISMVIKKGKIFYPKELRRDAKN